MKKKYLILAAVVMSFALLAGCATTNQNVANSPINPEVKAPMTAKITAGKKITGQATINSVMYFFTWGADKFMDGVSYNAVGDGGMSFLPASPVAKAKQAAAYNACTANNAEVLLSPVYTVEDTSYIVYHKITASVTGYAGKIDSIESDVPAK